MPDVRWIKIVTDIFDDDKILLIESMPEADAIIVIWFKLLCLAGKQNNSGVFILNDKLAYTDEMFATIFRRPLNTVRLALKTFEEFGMIEIINGAVTIPNWEKHQKLDALEASKEATKNRVARYREKQKLLADHSNVTCNVTVTDCNADREDKIRIDKNREESISSIDDALQSFVEFWKVYPRHEAKQDAIKAWKSLKPSDELCARIKADVQRRLSVGGSWYKAERQFVPLPATYIRGRRWEDENQPMTEQLEDKPAHPVHWSQLPYREQLRLMEEAEERERSGELFGSKK